MTNEEIKKLVELREIALIAKKERENLKSKALHYGYNYLIQAKSPVPVSELSKITGLSVMEWIGQYRATKLMKPKLIKDTISTIKYYVQTDAFGHSLGGEVYQVAKKEIAYLIDREHPTTQYYALY